MTLADLRRAAELLPPGASLTLPREALLAALGAGAPEVEGNGKGIDKTVVQLAASLGRSASTIRTWCERGELPGAYKLHDREWRIPAAAVEALQRAAAMKHAAAPERQARTRGKLALGAWREHLPSLTT